MSDIQHIVQLLQEQNICKQSGEITFHFMKQDIPVVTKDVIGGVLQDWFGNWLKSNGIEWDNTGVHSQSWPDFILSDGEHLEFKSFDSDANPNFDLANFDAYTRSLLTHAERLDTDHLVFAYRLNENCVEIVDFWVKKIWEMTGSSPTNFLNLQVKQGSPINIRPKNWRSPRVETFESRLAFIRALNQALQHFHPNRHPNWLEDVCSDYRSKTGCDL